MHRMGHQKGDGWGKDKVGGNSDWSRGGTNSISPAKKEDNCTYLEAQRGGKAEGRKKEDSTSSACTKKLLNDRSSRGKGIRNQKNAAVWGRLTRKKKRDDQPLSSFGERKSGSGEGKTEKRSHRWDRILDGFDSSKEEAIRGRRKKKQNLGSPDTSSSRGEGGSMKNAPKKGEGTRRREGAPRHIHREGGPRLPFQGRKGNH